MKDWIKVVLVLLVIKIVFLVGFFFFSPSLNLESCDDECVWEGYDSGRCAWSSEALEEEVRVGNCFIENSKHCGKRGRCDCYCKLGEQIIGGDTDEHGCYLMAGYNWCESKQECLRSWEEECPI